VSRKIKVIIDNRIRVRVGDSELADHLKARFTHDNPHREALRYMDIPGWWAEPKRYETWNDDGDGWLSVPRGGFARVKQEAHNLGRGLHVEDHRCLGTPQAGGMPDHDLSLYPHQQNAVEVILARENGLLKAPTGSGKTSVAMAMAARTGLRTLVIVPNRVLLEQWSERAQRELHLTRKQIGEVRGGTFRIGDITIGVAASVGKHASNPEFARQFGTVIADEVSLFAAKTFFSAIDPLPARYRIGVSADHKRKDKKEFLITDLFGDDPTTLHQKDLIASGHILDVTIKIVPTNFRADWYGLGEEDREIDFARLIREMSEDRDRNRLIVEATREAARVGQVVVFAHTREHVLNLEQVISGMGTSTGLLIGGDDYSKVFAHTIEGLRKGQIQVGVGTYKAIALGVDIPRLGYGIAATPIAANKQLLQQVRGRICRTATGKVSATLVYPWDRFVFPTHAENLARWNANTVILDPITKNWIPAKDWVKQNKSR